MVKNEVLCLQKCLDSIVEIADEIVIVDTGSTDGTQDIILQYTNALHTWEWNDDFAAARSYVASLATGQYVCRWDADWILRTGDIKKILMLKEQGFRGVDEIHFNWINEFEPESLMPTSMVTHMFLYKRELFGWHCRVPAHDMTYPLNPGREISKHIEPDIWVYHEKDPITKKHRYDQTHQLIQKHLQTLSSDHPDWLVNLQFYLSSCLFNELYEEVLWTIEEMLKSIDHGNDLFHWLLEQHVITLLNLSRISEAYEKGFCYYQKYHEYHTILALADVVALIDPVSAVELYQEYQQSDFSGHNLDLNRERYRVHSHYMIGLLTQDKDKLEQVLVMSRKNTVKEDITNALKKLRL